MRSFNLMKQLAIYHDVNVVCVVQESVVKNYFPSLEEAIEKATPAFLSFCQSVSFVSIRSQRRYEKKANLIKSLFSTKSYAASRLENKVTRDAIKKAVMNVKPDVIHLDTVAAGVYLPLFEDIDLVLNHHNIESEMMLRRAREASNFLLKTICYLDGFKIRMLEKKLFSKVKNHLVCSDLDKMRFLSLFQGANIFVVPNGIDCTLPSIDRSPVHGKLLFIGGLDWYPNSDAMRFFLKSVWPDLNKIMPEVTLDIVGKCPPSDLIEIASAYTNVKLHGFVDDISGFYKEAWIYICPIMDGGGTKLKVLDAMANGVLLVAHPIAMEGIDAVPDEHFKLADSAHEFVAAISAIKNTTANQIKSIEHAAKTLIQEKYDYEKIGKVLSSAYL
ncbi:glycosyltransferase [Cellvibrio sp. pealriver]|uniref:glycosyltransferase n=1 Tax=Cellvibrio sp. pealriver TaxID=1622269 RepID=UPI0009E22C74|nr:glycosyltransferase [Cellvibrio sp. pealriver]